MLDSTTLRIPARSPSMRREWIEMLSPAVPTLANESPSMRREWIEMTDTGQFLFHQRQSPSMRREWIEIKPFTLKLYSKNVSLHAEGVD